MTAPTRFTLVAVEVLHHPVPDPNAASAAGHRLYQLANALLQRRTDGCKDDLVLVGIGFADEEAMRVAVAPFGLNSASLLVADIAGGDVETALDAGELIGLELELYIPKRHPGAIPLASWPPALAGAGYPGDLWWMGMECLPEQSGSWADALQQMLPSAFEPQAAAWEAVLSAVEDLERDGARATLLAGLVVASAARWLWGFSAVSDNDFFDFTYGEVRSTLDFDPFLLGFEAATHHQEDLSGEVEDEDVGVTEDRAVRALLKGGRYLDTSALRRFFGGSASLLYSLHASIWPQFSVSASDACLDLSSPSGDDIPEAMARWSFVNDDDWSDVDDSI